MKFESGTSLLAFCGLLVNVGISYSQVCALPPAGLIAWWSGDGNAKDIAGGNQGTLHNGVIFAAGTVGQAFGLDGATGFVQVPHNPSLDPGTGSFTIDAWIKTTSLQTQAVVSKYECGGSCPSFVANSYYAPFRGQWTRWNPGAVLCVPWWRTGFVRYHLYRRWKLSPRRWVERYEFP